MLLLAFDTTSRRGSVALWEGDALRGEARLDLEAGHSRWVLGAAQLLLAGAGREIGDLGGLAVTTGPGSFTGVRVGLASVQGLALGTRLPCLGLSSLDVLGHRVRGCAPRVAVLVDAWRGELFTAEYDAAGRRTREPALETPEALIERLRQTGWAVVGDGALKHRARLEAELPGLSFPERSLFLAGALAELAAPRLEAGEGQPPERLRPLYLRPPTLRRAGP